MTTNHNTYDIAIVGAGPAGSTAAFLLARQGYRVVLVDKRHFPRPKLCAGLLTWKCVELLKSVYGHSVDDMISRGIISHRTFEYRIHHGSAMIARGRLDYPFHFVNRTTYDHFWLQTAMEAGARVITGQAVRQVDPSGGILLLASGRRIESQVIVGADGVWSMVRRCACISPGKIRRWRSQLAMTIEARCPHVGEKPPRDYAALHFGYVPWGYAWSFPGCKQRIVGICSLRQKDERPFAEGFERFLSSAGLDQRAAGAWQGHALPYGNFMDPPGRGRILLVGDACGLADPLLGEGIYYAHRSAQIAARSIMASAPAYRNLDRIYRTDLNRQILRELRWIKTFRNLLFAGGRRRRFRGLGLLFRVMPKRLEAAIQGQLPFSRLFLPLGPGRRTW